MKPTPPIVEPPRLSRFRVLRELGKGAQGTVHEAIDLERNVRVALKTLRRLGPDEIVRFKAEFRAVRDLRHPSLVSLGELIEEEGRWYFTMELVAGVDFLAHVRAGRAFEESTSWPTRSESGERTRRDVRVPSRAANGEASASPSLVPEPAPSQPRALAAFDEGRLRRALKELAFGLTFLHRAGKAHRDLKPSNVLVDADGRVVLIDFGVVAELAQDDGEDRQVVGTVPYMAPEQVLGEAVRPEADWYAVGVLLFEALTGRRPFEGESSDVMERKCILDAPRPSDFVRDVPPDLEALCMRMLARDARQRPTDEEVLFALGADESGESEPEPQRSAAFVGRRPELAALDAAFARVREGVPLAVFLEGESGVGKSALAKQFVDGVRARPRRAVVLQGRCHEQERVPYNAFDAVIDALARYVRGRREEVRELLVPAGMDRLRTVFPALGVIDGARPSSAPKAFEARAERDQAFAVLRELLSRVASRRPTVMLLEDVQWADADSLALLEVLTAPPNAPPLLLLATARSRAGGEPCAALSAVRGEVRRIPVAGLSPEDAAALVDRLVAGREGRAAIDADTIVRGSRGHPLFIEELVRFLGQRGARAGRAGEVALDDALWARIADFDRVTRRVLALVAVAGMPAAQAALAEAAAMPFATFAERVSELREAKLVRVRGARPEDAIEPYHDRVREAVYARIGGHERAELHAALGRAFEGRAGGPELLFHHFAAAGDTLRAARYAESAAEAAARALAFDRAAALYQSALAMGAPEPAHRRRLLAALGARLTDAGRSKEAAESYLLGADTAGVTPDERLDLLRKAAEQFLMSGYVEEGLTTLREVLGAFGLSLPASRLAALARLGWYQLRLGLHSLTWEDRSASEVDPKSAARIDLCWSVGAGLGLIDSVRSMLFIDLGALFALESGDVTRVARALAASAVAEAGLGRRPQAARLGEACRRAASVDASERTRFYAELTTLTFRFFLDNDWHRCLEGTRAAQALWRASGHTEGWEADLVDQFACWSLDNIGRFVELRERVPAKVRAAQRAGNRFIEVNFRTQFVHLHLLPDHPAEARRDVLDAIASWPRVSTDFGNQDYLALRNLTYIALYEGDVTAAEALLPQWKRFFDSLMGRVLFLKQDALFFVGSTALARAVRARARGEASEAKRRLREAQGAQRDVARIAMPMARAYALHLRAGIAAVQGDDAAAVSALRDALAHAEARDTELNTACLRLRLAELIEGDEGARLRELGSAWMRAQGASAPGRLVAAALPGFRHPG